MRKIITYNHCNFIKQIINTKKITLTIKSQSINCLNFFLLSKIYFGKLLFNSTL